MYVVGKTYLGEQKAEKVYGVSLGQEVKDKSIRTGPSYTDEDKLLYVTQQVYSIIEIKLKQYR